MNFKFTTKRTNSNNERRKKELYLDGIPFLGIAASQGKLKKQVFKDYTINKEKIIVQTCSFIAIALLSGIGERAPHGPLRHEIKLV